MLEVPYFIRGCVECPTRQARYCQQNVDLARLNVRQTENLDRDGQGRITAYTDGTACNPDDHMRRRVAWGVYYPRDHGWTCNGTIDDELQSLCRAELMAIKLVMQSANSPTHIVSDCFPVVNTMRDIIGRLQLNIRGDYSDLWAQIQQIVHNKPPEYFTITWVPSHTDTEKAEEA